MYYLTLALLLCIFLVNADPPAYTVSGCDCLSECARTIDSPFTPWCYTSPRPPEDDESIVYCGQYSPSRQAYWEECIVPSGAIGTDKNTHLTTFASMWITMTATTVVTTGAVYLIIGCYASILTAQRLLFWFPTVMFAIGTIHSLIFGGFFSVIMSFLYLSIPYAIDLSVGIALGIGMAMIILYRAMGRHYEKIASLHLAEYID